MLRRNEYDLTQRVIAGTREREKGEVRKLSKYLNVHGKMDKEGEEYCIRVNREIRSITESIIRFGPESTDTLPHITLAMGPLREKADLEDVAEAVGASINGLLRPILHIGQPYVSRTNGRYILSDIVEDLSFKRLRTAVRQGLDPLFQSLGKENDSVSHVTLGYVEHDQDLVSDRLQSMSARISTVIESVEISNTGPKGTCVDSIYVFPLLKSNRTPPVSNS
jgi:hypothetical protein